MKLQPVRGTRDIFGNESLLFKEIEQRFEHWAQIYDFQPMETPVFEFSQVFKRSLGDETDIVTKEMYTFEDRSGDSLTLRPEGTASVARALISNSLLRELPAKFYYSGPMFRHERPQKGRYRQFYQFGIELIGVDSALADIEVLSCAWNFLKSCGLESKVSLEINSLGDKESRENYRQKLTEHFSQYSSQLSEDSQRRLNNNPLRILDSKDEADQKFIATAPNFSDSLTEESQKFFDQLCNGLAQLGIPYQVSPRLVRGLDYYTHTVFEFVTTHLGSQGAVLSGGRYNQLISQLGGPPTQGVGWAAGMDRLALLLEQPQHTLQTVGVVAAQPQLDMEVLKLVESLRLNHVPAQMIYSGNVSKQLKKADKRNCSHVVILGEQEVKSGIYTLKNLKTGEQSQANLQQTIDTLKSYYEHKRFNPSK